MTLAGRRVGQVASVQQGTKGKEFETRVVVRIDADIAVDDKAKLIVTKYGLLDPPTLSLKPGGGGRLTGGKSVGSAQEIVDGGVTPGGMQELMDSGSQLLSRLNKTWEETVDPALKSLRMEVNKDVPDSMFAKAHTLLTDADEAVKSARALIEENRPDLKKIASSLAGKIDAIASELDKLLADADAVMVHADGILVENDRNIYETIHQLKETMYHMKQFARKVEADPSQLLFGSQPVEESRGVQDQTDWRLKGRTGPYTQEVRAKPKDATTK